MPEAFILSAVRTPIGKFLGGLSSLSAPQLGALVIEEALRRAGLSGDQVDEVIMGNVLQAGVGQNPARQAALKAGLPNRMAAYTVNKVCGSGLKAIMLAAQAIRAGDADIVVAGGMESMSNAPYLLFGARGGWKYGDQKAVDAMIHDGLWCAFENWHMGEAAEHTAKKYGVSRADQDRFAARSHQRAAAAWERGAFNAETMSVTISPSSTFSRDAKRSAGSTFTRDEGIRPDTNAQVMSKLEPAFRPEGTVTAGNSSMLSDGAAAIVVVSGRALERITAKPLARFVSYATSGVDPKEVFIAPVPAIRLVLEKASLSTSDIDLIELNEAFASQMLACARELKLDEERVNVNGGAIALGHPIGASGARVLTTLLYSLQQRGLRRGLASLCLGGGNAVAMIVETLS
jgi:acetyl-CoA C-acetyltransferase